MSKTFKQGNYNPVHGISMKLSGCGPCASASVLCNLDGSINPVKVANWLYDHGHFYSSGTTRAGITDVLQKHGMEVFLVTGGPSSSRLENPMVPKTISGPVAAITCQQLI